MIYFSVVLGSQTRSELEEMIENNFRFDKCIRYFEYANANGRTKELLNNGSIITKIIITNDDKDHFTELIRITPIEQLLMLDILFYSNGRVQKIRYFTELVRKDELKNYVSSDLNPEDNYHFWNKIMAVDANGH